LKGWDVENPEERSMMKNRIRQHTKRAAGTICVLALAGFSFDCVNKPLAPVAPTWATQMTAPVSMKSYTLADLVSKDSSLLGITPGGTQIVYNTTFQADPTFVGNLVSLSSFTSASQVQLGVFSVNDVSYALPVTFPAWFPRGMTTPIPQATIAFDLLQGSLPGLDSVSFQSGIAELHVRNNLPVPVTVQNPITLRDASGNLCGTFDFSGKGPIAPGTELVATMDLAGVFLTHTISLAGVTLSEPGTAVPLPVPADSLVVARIVARNLVVRTAVVTTLPPQIAVNNVTRALALKDSNLVKELYVKSGRITIHFQSGLPVDASFRYSIGELLTPAGSVYTDNVSLPARGSFDRTIDLAMYRLHSSDGSYIAALDVTGSVALTPAGGGAPVRIQESDNISFALTATSIVADSVVGVTKPTWVNVNTVLPLNLGDLTKKFKGQVNIPAATLRLLPQSTIRFPLQLDLKLQAEGNHGQLLSELNVPPTTTSGAMLPIDFVPGEVGRFLSSISGQLPDSLRVRGAVLVNPQYDISTPQSVGSGSWFGGKVQVSFPLLVSLTGGEFADTASIGDTSGAGQGHTLADAKTAGQINSIKLHVVVDNAIPLQVALKLHLLDRAKRLLLDLPQTAGDSITIPAPAVLGGIVQSPSHAERIIQLAGTEVQQFNNASSVAYVLGVSTAGADPVSFESTQAIRIRVWAEFSYQVNK
jgi:hypothetical protein